MNQQRIAELAHSEPEAASDVALMLSFLQASSPQRGSNSYQVSMVDAAGNEGPLSVPFVLQVP